MAETKTADDTVRRPHQDPEVLEEVKERFEYGTNEWKDIRDEGAKDMRFLYGDHWDPEERRARDENHRLCLSFDELNQYVNQLVNDVRAQDRAIKVSPDGNGADDSTAQFRGGLIREIEYKSNAQIAYTTAFEDAASRSYGFARISPSYCVDEYDPNDPAAITQQELGLEPIVNPDLVTIDPDFKRPDASDMQWAFVHERMKHSAYLKAYPWAQIRSFDSDTVKEHTPWVSERDLMVAEYWRVHTVKREFLLLKPLQEGDQPLGIYVDDIKKSGLPMPADELILKSRIVEEKKVQQYLTNGVELLKFTEWPGRYIPILACFGKIRYIDTGAGVRRVIESLVRRAREPQQAYSYTRTTQIELVKAAPRFPYFVREESLSDTAWKDLLRSVETPIAAIEVRSQIPGVPGFVPEFPTRNPYEPPIERLEILAEALRRSIQASIGASGLPTEAQRVNNKSGVALDKIEANMAKGSYHFVDHFEFFIRHAGVVADDLLGAYYDTPREVGIRMPNDSTKRVRINDPSFKDEELGGPLYVKSGKHGVTISTGPGHESQRAMSSEFADTLIGSAPLMQIVGPEKGQKLVALAIKLKGVGPVGDQMAEIIAPEETDQGGAQQLAAMEQHLSEAQQIIQTLTQALEELQQKVETDEAKAQQAFILEKFRAEMDERLTAMKASIDREKVLLQADIAAQAREDEQRHELGLKAAEAVVQDERAERAAERAEAQAERQAQAQGDGAGV